MVQATFLKVINPFIGFLVRSHSYIFPRLYLELTRRKVKLLSARVVGDILDIQLEKPGAWERTQRAGMYVP
jgi:hypothetical protein